eukprot:CAMPEP_0115740860 /NCGR_PEP_ID=MMETSP0272-20121206/89702_1 /TAXON_ID=71861 /ORGANISM="Scrippsiella trochoidea, Strain CCMP3099" /LENGTH=113 /DNA_ID=CAMNT_0003185509 /DNA_START=111 /DNA_END=451 /DNA_ORIENTATION=-
MGGAISQQHVEGQKISTELRTGFGTRKQQGLRRLRQPLPLPWVDACLASTPILIPEIETLNGTEVVANPASWLAACRHRGAQYAPTNVQVVPQNSACSRRTIPGHRRNMFPTS